MGRFVVTVHSSLPRTYRWKSQSLCILLFAEISQAQGKQSGTKQGTAL